MLVSDVVKALYERYKNSEEEVSSGYDFISLNVAHETVEIVDVKVKKGKKKKTKEVITRGKAYPIHVLITESIPNSIY